MAQLQGTMEDLRRSKLDLPPKAKANETPAMPFGLFTEPVANTTTTTTAKSDDKEVQSNLAITDVKGLIYFIGYRLISIIAK